MTTEEREKRNAHNLEAIAFAQQGLVRLEYLRLQLQAKAMAALPGLPVEMDAGWHIGLTDALTWGLNLELPFGAVTAEWREAEEPPGLSGELSASLVSPPVATNMDKKFPRDREGGG